MKTPTITLKNNRLVAILITIFTFLFITSCGDSVGDNDSEGALFNSTMTVTPSSVEWKAGDLMGTCAAVDTGFNLDQVFQVSLRDASNKPLNGENILAIVDLAGNNSQLVTVTQLWEDVNQNEVIDAGDVLSSDAGDGALDLKTNSDGVVRFIVRLSAGCAFRANLLVLTDGGPTDSISIEVTE